MDLTVSQAARTLGVAPSTLRYWESEGLLEPARHHGDRRYGREHLRRAALLALARRLGLPLARAVEVLDTSPRDVRRGLVDAEVARLRTLIDDARGAIELLHNAADCSHEHPAATCPRMRGALDRLLAGDDARPAGSRGGSGPAALPPRPPGG